MTKLNYGGQAVLEGVMMRGEREYAVCVRNPAGEIVCHHAPLPPAIYRSRVLKWPFLRGLVMLWDSLGLGLRALTWSADVALGAEEQDQQASFSGVLGWGTIALALAFGVGLFVLLPMFLVSLVDRHLTSSLLSNLVEGLVRLGLFLAYLWAIGFLPDIRRVFAYHGAEHKTINAYEHGAALTPEAIAPYPKAHTRCGTAFLLIVLVIFVLLSTLLGRPPLVWRILSRIALIPFVAGLAYEVLKLTAKYYERSALVRLLVAPSLVLQSLTTREPTPEMLEVSIAALRQVLSAEGLLPQTEIQKSQESGVEENKIPQPSVG